MAGSLITLEQPDKGACQPLSVSSGSLFSVLDLFSGIGGFALATAWAGGRTQAFCEIGEYQRHVLRARWPDTPIYNDVTKLCRRAYDCESTDDDSGNAWCPRCSADFGDCECIGTDQYTDTLPRAIYDREKSPARSGIINPAFSLWLMGFPPGWLATN